ncbi:MAG: metallophosphoesterase family protein [Rhodothermales bacterium]|nr:metallophosphoesterase family protein [Rhodothermales bacterium]
MLIGIIADTHGYFHPSIPTYFTGVDLILHAGDVGTPDILDRLEELAPTRTVWGNIDGQSIRRRSEEHYKKTVGGVRIWMTHIAGRPGAWQRGIGALLRDDPPDLLICGHSHILRIERDKSLRNMLYINPGAAGQQGFHLVKTCVRLTLTDGKATQAEVIHLDEPRSV